MTPEKKVQNAILKYLKSLSDQGYPVLYFRRQAGGFNYKAGLPDIYFIWNGRHAEVEVKAAGGSPSALQLSWQKRFEANGSFYVRAESLAEFKEFVRQNFLPENG